jgi:lipopolysaccharide/colanic/teichoic acid biosynthesis glycosyltransferase
LLAVPFILLCLQHFYRVQTRLITAAIYLQKVRSAIVESLPLPAPAAQSVSYTWLVLSAAERSFAGAALLMLSPLLLSSACVLVALSRRSPLVAHQRVGQSGRPLWILKLRTMWAENSHNAALVVEKLPSAADDIVPAKTPGDPRITSRFAAFCRRYSIDELPQLWHVVQGTMALVGPRPLTKNELQAYYGSDAAHLLAMRPGLSGLWQVSGRSRLTYRQRRRLDLLMIRKWSIALYLRILLVTLPKVVGGRDAW